MSKIHLMRLFKGAAAGSHYYINNARISGFSATPGVKNVHSIVGHITSFSWPSPYLSFSASPAIARSYALPAGGSVGRIYEIDTDLVDLEICDPIYEISSGFGKLSKFTGHLWHLHHEGDEGLIAAVADGKSPPSPVFHRQTQKIVPNASRAMQAMVFALRDAEVLIAGQVPSNCVVHHWDV